MMAKRTKLEGGLGNPLLLFIGGLPSQKIPRPQKWKHVRNLNKAEAKIERLR